MSLGGPPQHLPFDKEKGIAKPRKRRNNYVLRVPPRPFPSIPVLHMPSLSSLASPIGLHTPTFIPVLHMPSSSSSYPPRGLVTLLLSWHYIYHHHLP